LDTRCTFFRAVIAYILRQSSAAGPHSTWINATMRTRNKRGLQPNLEGMENRCLLSTAVLEILNQSSYNITFDFRWSNSSRWTNVTERPGQGEIFWTAYSTSLTPQVLYNTTTSAFSQTTVNLVQGYNEWPGTGPPPASAATPYEFVNTPTGVELSVTNFIPLPCPFWGTVSKGAAPAC